MLKKKLKIRYWYFGKYEKNKKLATNILKNAQKNIKLGTNILKIKNPIKMHKMYALILKFS